MLHLKFNFRLKNVCFRVFLYIVGKKWVSLIVTFIYLTRIINYTMRRAKTANKMPQDTEALNEGQYCSERYNR